MVEFSRIINFAMIYKSPNMEANRIKGKAQGLT